MKSISIVLNQCARNFQNSSSSNYNGCPIWNATLCILHFTDTLRQILTPNQYVHKY